MTWTFRSGAWLGAAAVAGLLVTYMPALSASPAAPGLSDKDDNKGSDNGKGAKGDKGTVGPQGPAGPAGPVGASGATGPAGPTGATGAAGANGTSLAVTAIDPGGLCGAIAGANISDGTSSVPVCDGAKGDKGDTGPAGADAPGVTGESGDFPGSPGLPLNVPFNTGGTVVLTKHVTGFKGYMIWANAALGFQTVNGTPSPTQATCAIFQTVNSVTTQLDFRSLNVLLPSGQPQAFVRYALSLVSDSGEFNKTDIVTYTLQCGTPANNPATPVLATSSSIAVVGLNAIFGLDGN